MKNDYVLSESDSDIVFAVITADNKTDLIKLVSLAIKEEFSYEKVTFRNDSYSERSGTVFMSFDCLGDGDEDEDSEIREIELNLTAIYNVDNLKLTDEEIIKNCQKDKREMMTLMLLGLLVLSAYSYGCFLKYFDFDNVFFFILMFEIIIGLYYFIKAQLKIKSLQSKTE